MTTTATAPAGRAPRASPGPWLRWGLPGGLLLLELLALSVLVDLPLEGPAMALVSAVRVAAPVALAGAAAGWLLARGAGPPSGPPPPWRPLPALALQPLAFAAAAALGLRLLGPGAPPPAPLPLAAWLALLCLAAALAAASAAPLGWSARRLAARWLPLLLALGVGAAAWRLAAGAEALWGLLSGGTLRGVAALLALGGGEVVVDPAERLVGLDGFEVLIAPVCSGADGAGLVVLFLATWIALARDRLRAGRALLLLPLGAAAALLANVVRITLLIRLGASGQEALALGGFHSKLGWILFLGLALGGAALAERWPWLRRDGAAAAGGAGAPEQAGPLVGPLLAALGAALLTGTWAEGPLDRAYGLRVAAALAALLAVRRALPPARLVLRGAAAPVLLGAAVGVAWLLAARGDPAPLAAALGALGPAERAAWLAVRVAGAVAVVPLVEELAFRGFLLPWLVSPDLAAAGPRGWTPAAVVLSSLAFGLLHAHWALGALAGLAFAAARLRRGLLGDAVLAHAACNAVLAAAALLGGRLDLWG